MTILSEKLNLSEKCAKMGCFAPTCPKLDKQLMEGFCHGMS